MGFHGITCPVMGFHGTKTLKIGTRGSPLALRQTAMVVAELARVRPDLKTETIIIKTSGDWTPEQGEGRIEHLGGKALFAKELEEALLEGRIDAAVHSMKDMESVLPKGLAITCTLAREDVRDAIILKDAGGISDLAGLPHGAKIGTCSLRRQGMLLAARPDLEIISMRGNVGTRLQKLQAGELAGIVLAKAGLNRLEMAKNVSFMVPIEQMIPAAGQGAIGIETKQENEEVVAVFSQINCQKTFLQVLCERTALAELGGSCHTPVGSHAILEGESIWLRMRLVSPDGKKIYEEEGRAGQGDAADLGREVGRKLREKSPAEFL
jgi:hydroxymethylbilane synthase